MRPQNAQQAHVVLECGNADFRTGFDHPVNIINVAIALGALAEHDGAAFFVVDVARSQKGESDHVERNAMLLAEVARPRKILDGPMAAMARIEG